MRVYASALRAVASLLLFKVPNVIVPIAKAAVKTPKRTIFFFISHYFLWNKAIIQEQTYKNIFLIKTNDTRIYKTVKKIRAL